MNAGRQLRLLIVDDRRADCERIVLHLEQEFGSVRWHQVGSEAAMPSDAELADYDLVITEYHLPWTDGLAILANVRKARPDCPVIMVTEQGDVEIAVEGMKRGLSDYLVKSPGHYRLLPQASRRATTQARVQADERRLRRRLRGLLNRLSIGIFQCTAGGILQTANPAFFEFLRIKDSSGDDIDLTSEFENPAEVRKLFSSALRSRRQLQAEFELRPIDGRRWAMLTVALGSTETDTPCIEGAIEDVTERRKAEERLRDSRMRLRQLAAHLEAVREAERSRIAGEIHDHFGQALTGLKMDIAWLRPRIEGHSAKYAAKLEDMAVLIDTTTDQIGRLATELRPRLLDELGLAAAIGWQADEFQSRSDIKTSVEIDPDLDCPNREQATDLFRAFQELLTNVARHAEASRVDIRLEQAENQLRLTVRDDGRGIEQEDLKRPTSFGIEAVSERVNRWGGTLTIDGSPGQGTTAVITVERRRAKAPKIDRTANS